MPDTVVIHCPYCGESYETVADPSAGSQRYVEDCAVCCRPIEIVMHVDDNGELLDVSTSTDSE
ncbi:MAG: CPXCG motif-containing cysteine-rich protein [Rudaea sp.]|nr:CPXCG motif-containing cysteine-rich protein [Rudaea sp.]